MKVGDSIRKAIDDWELGELESSMLHACNAVDGTASKRYPTEGSNARFTRFLRDSYAVLGPMSAPGIDLFETRWPVKVARPKASGGHPDIADVIYGVHRCTHGHGDELPDGFGLIADAAGQTSLTRMVVEKGKVRLSDRIIFGLLAATIVAPESIGQIVPPTYHLTFAGEQLLINEWWGRTTDFLLLTSRVTLPSVKLDFTDWMTVAT